MATERLERDKWRALRAMSAADSLRVGEALWTSDLARRARPPRSPRPVSLAILLGIRSRQ